MIINDISNYKRCVCESYRESYREAVRHDSYHDSYHNKWARSLIRFKRS